MSKVELSLSVPKTLGDIKLSQYQEYVKVLEMNEDAKDTEEGADFLNKKALEIFCGLELKDSYNVPLKTFMFALEHINTIFKAETPLKRHFKFKDINGKEQLMGFIPNLENMSFGEYVDANTYFNTWEDAHKLMAVLFRPVRMLSGERYKIEEYKGSSVYGEAMKEMPLDIVFGAKVFFYRLSMKLARGTLKSLEKNPELLDKSKGILPKDLDGIQAFMRSQEVMLEELMRRQRFHLEVL